MTQSLHSTLANFTYRQTGGVFTQLKKAVLYLCLGNTNDVHYLHRSCHGKTCVNLTAKQTSATMQPVILVTFTRKFSIVKQSIHISLNFIPGLLYSKHILDVLTSPLLGSSLIEWSQLIYMRS